MNISLTPELEKYVQNKVACGLYTSISEVIRESLRLMHTHDDFQEQRINQLTDAINLGLAQLKVGKKVSATKSYQRLKKKIQTVSNDT